MKTAHFWQYAVGGYARGIGKLGTSQIVAGVSKITPGWSYDPYKQVGNLEWIADEVYRELFKHRY
jgi:hypothetical protein